MPGIAQRLRSRVLYPDAAVFRRCTRRHLQADSIVGFTTSRALRQAFGRSSSLQTGKEKSQTELMEKSHPGAHPMPRPHVTKHLQGKQRGTCYLTSSRCRLPTSGGHAVSKVSSALDDLGSGSPSIICTEPSRSRIEAPMAYDLATRLCSLSRTETFSE